MSPQAYAFRNYRLDPAARELWHDDTLVALPSRAFDCLVYLIQHRDRAVGRDELIAAVWGRIDIADTLLAQTILRLRRAIGDSGSEGAIRTVARFGYRWVEETHELDPVADSRTTSSSDSEASAPAPSDPKRPRPLLATHLRPGFAVLVLAFVALIVVLAPWTNNRSDPDPVESGNQRTASPDRPETGDGENREARVLPAIVPDLPEWAWLRLGLMDMVGNRLRQSGLPTMSSESVLSLLSQGKPGPAGSSADGLLIRPSAIREPDQWRVRLEIETGRERRRVEATADEVVDAAHKAADLLLIQLGRQPVAVGHSASQPLADLLARVRSAILADRFDLALHLIADASPALQARPEVALERANIEQGQGHYAEAERMLLALRDRIDADAEPAMRGRVSAALGSVLFRQSNLDAAEQAFAEAITLLDGRNDPVGLAQALTGRAAIASRDERLDDAAADLGRAKVEMEASGNLLGSGQVDMNLGLIQIKRYRPATALPLFDAARQRFQTLGAREELAYVHYVLAGAQLQLLDLDGARASVAAFWPPEQHTGNQRLHWLLALSRSFVLTASGELDDAENQLEAILVGASAQDDAGVLLGVHALAASLVAIRGDHRTAVDRLRHVLTPTLAERRPDLFVSTWTTYLRSLRHIGPPNRAREETDRFSSWVDEHPGRWRSVQRALALAEQAWAEHPDDDALALFETAFDLAQDLAIPEDLVHVAEPYAMALIRQGRLDRASDVVGRIAAWAGQDVRAAWAQASLFYAQGRTDAWQRAMERVERLRGQRPLPSAEPHAPVAPGEPGVL